MFPGAIAADSRFSRKLPTTPSAVPAPPDEGTTQYTYATPGDPTEGYGSGGGYEPGSWGPLQADTLVAEVGGWNTPQ